MQGIFLERILSRLFEHSPHPKKKYHGLLVRVNDPHSLITAIRTHILGSIFTVHFRCNK